MNNRLSAIYTPLEDAASELHARRTACPPDGGGLLETHLARRCCAVLFRQLATPNFELERFVSLASAVGLAPLVVEFHRDKFVTRNVIKYSLARMGFHAGTGRRGGPRVRFVSVANLSASDGVLLGDVVTKWGQGIVPFHHELLATRPALSGLELIDASDWFLSHRGGARGYYTDFLSLFARHAVLFETFLTTPDERPFSSQVVIPAFEAASAQHGCRPLVCRLDPAEAEGLPYWLQYPDDMREHVLTKLARHSTLT